MKTIKGEGVLTLEDIQFYGFKMFNSIAVKTSTDALHDAKVSKVNVKTSIKDNVKYWDEIRASSFRYYWYPY